MPGEQTDRWAADTLEQQPRADRQVSCRQTGYSNRSTRPASFPHRRRNLLDAHNVWIKEGGIWMVFLIWRQSLKRLGQWLGEGCFQGNVVFVSTSVTQTQEPPRPLQTPDHDQLRPLLATGCTCENPDPWTHHRKTSAVEYPNLWKRFQKQISKTVK